MVWNYSDPETSDASQDVRFVRVDVVIELAFGEASAESATVAFLEWVVPVCSYCLYDFSSYQDHLVA